jgi:hypothetical protein
MERAASVWDALSADAGNRCLYNSSRWVRILREAYGFDTKAALLHDNGSITAGCMFARAARPFSSNLIALPFSDEAPPLAVDNTAAERLMIALRDAGGYDSLEIRGVSAPDPWQAIDCYLSWKLDISEPSKDLFKRLATNFRRNLAKAGRSGLTLDAGTSASHVRRYYRLHSAARRRLGLPSQPAGFFQTVSRVLGDDIEVWIASRGERDRAGIFVIRDRDTLYLKWSARSSIEAPGVVQLLTWSIIEKYAETLAIFDLGRTDTRNSGLNRFKRELGGQCAPLPYVFLPRAPRNISAESLSGWQHYLARIWRVLPPSGCRLIERYAYKYLS